ncbi:MAG: DUF3417 domain-containing protein [Planctomycetota bacterium]
MTFNLFEVSWEVANKVGGIHTVVSSKARELVERFGDRYVVIGPWLHGQQVQTRPFDEEPGFEGFVAACQRRGISVRVGRWNVPGRPRTLLVGFSKLFESKDAILAGLWERHGVDSLVGGWDYIEPAMFGHAAGMVIEAWLEHEAEPGRAVAQFHEWMTGSGALYLKDNVPHVATIFTTHATMLGRALSATGLPPDEALGNRTPEEVAAEIGVRAKHSMEGACARGCDVFTTVSAITAAEAELLHRRQPRPLMPNGLDLGLLEELSSAAADGSARQLLTDVAACMCGEDLSKAMLVATSGRYEMHNKGIDVLLDALALVDREPGDPVVCFVLVPAGVSGPRRKVKECLIGQRSGRIGISTHELIDRENDPVQRQCERLGLLNDAGSRVKIVQVPVYLDGTDTIVPLQYEAALRAMDLSAFPSFYEPWGYTPAESIGVGVPTVTTDMAGFGAWADENGLGPARGVTVLRRSGVGDAKHVQELAQEIQRFQKDRLGDQSLRAACLESAAKVSWKDLVRHYLEAFELALEIASDRPQPAPRAHKLVAVTDRDTRPAHAPRMHTFDVEARLPRELAPLERLAGNLWWSWDPDAQSLFSEISPDMWESCLHNPVLFLRRAYPRDLEVKAADADYVARLERVTQRFDTYMRSRRATLSLPDGGHVDTDSPIAYFCFEFGVHESVRIYSGGLGILAGDHLKSASDLDLPLLGVGLFYSGGYVQQRVTSHGEQVSLEAPNDPWSLPLELVRGADGEPIFVDAHRHRHLPLSESVVRLRAWKPGGSRDAVPAFDADHYSANGPQMRTLTQRLYGGDNEHRLRQELRARSRRQRAAARQASASGRRSLHLNSEEHAAFAARALLGPDAREEPQLRRGRAGRALVDGLHDARRSPRGTTASTSRSCAAGRHRGAGSVSDGTTSCDSARTPGAAPHKSSTRRSRVQPRASSTASRRSTARSAARSSRRTGPASFATRSRSHVTNGVHLPTWTRPGIQRARRRGATDRGGDFAAGAARVDRRALFEERQAAKRLCTTAATRSSRARSNSDRRARAPAHAHGVRTRRTRARDRIRAALRAVQAREPALQGPRSPRAAALRRGPALPVPVPVLRQGAPRRRRQSGPPAPDRRDQSRSDASSARSCSSGTTTSVSLATSSRASTSGSTIRCVRSRPAARRA